MAASRLIGTRDKNGKPAFVDPDAILVVATHFDPALECDVAQLYFAGVYLEMAYADFLRDIGPHMKAVRR